MLKKLLFAALAALWSGLTTAEAHDEGDAHSHASAAPVVRSWTLQPTQTELTGSFVSATGTTVSLRLSNGAIRPVEIAKLSPKDQEWVKGRMKAIAAVNTADRYFLTAQEERKARSPKAVLAGSEKPAGAVSFERFEETVDIRWDDRYLYVESSGIPDHRMMVGITAWQQQVPLPQKYLGANAWRIPLHPVPAAEPLSAKEHFFRGAIALAVNGIPIFNPIKNDGRTDTLLAGELDEFGGHCGRADDYHYHIAPVHLEETVGRGKPVAWALDGYPVFGYQQQDDPDFAPLDRWNGHHDKEGRYHYHATKTYPYLNGGFYGEVIERDGQVDPQPRAEPVRPALPPLPGARITDFKETDAGRHQLTYEIRGRKGTVTYSVLPGGSVAFEFVSPDGSKTTEEYRLTRDERRKGPPQESGPAKGQERPKRDGKKKGKMSADSEDKRSSSKPEAVTPASFSLQSSSIDKAGLLSVDCTCDGKAESPAIAWKNLPEGTKFLAVSLWHTAPDQEKSYWVVANIPATVKELKQNFRGIGTTGLNDRRRAEYDPMCSRGPGLKTYHLTVFALSQPLDLPSGKLTRGSLLEAVRGITLGEATLDFQYERP